MTSQPTLPANTAAPSVAVLLCNLGTPAEPTPAAVRTYLAQFLGDPRVVEIPPLVWKPILHGIILRTRPRQSAHKYQTIWTEEGSPLLAHTLKQAKLLRGWLGEAGFSQVAVVPAMRYGQPGIAQQLSQLHAQGVRRLLVLPLYPQYSSTTTASMIDAVNHWSGQQRDVPELRWINQYGSDTGYIKALERTVLEHWEAHGRAQKLVMSYHGIPERNIALGDPYQAQCLHTSRLLAQRLGLQESQYEVTFQSRFGRARWLQPYTQPTVEALAQSGVESVDLICPGFASDCLETLEEINMEVRNAFTQNGGKEFRYIPCLNEHPAWISALRDLVIANLGGWVAPPATSTRNAHKPA